MPLIALTLLYLALVVPCLSWLVRTAERLPYGWDYLLVVVCCLAWFLGWGMVGALLMTWD